MLLPLLLLAQAATTPMAPDMKMPQPVCVRAGDLPPAFAKWIGPIPYAGGRYAVYRDRSRSAGDQTGDRRNVRARGQGGDRDLLGCEGWYLQHWPQHRRVDRSGGEGQGADVRRARARADLHRLAQDGRFQARTRQLRVATRGYEGGYDQSDDRPQISAIPSTRVPRHRHRPFRVGRVWRCRARCRRHASGRARFPRRGRGGPIRSCPIPAADRPSTGPAS